MKKASLLLNLFICFTLVFSIVLPVNAQDDVSFKDIENSIYKQDILDLHEKGIISTPEDELFHVKRILTKAEAATLLVRAFKLPLIKPMIVDDPNIEKSFVYTDGLGVIDESFSVPSSKDIIDHWGYNYIEGLIKVRGYDLEGKEYFPNEKVTKSQWVEMISKVIFGVDQKINYTDKAIELGFFTSDIVNSDDLITREEAVGLLNIILKNPEFKTITVLATSDIHSHLIPYTPRGARYKVGALAKMSKIIKETREKQPNLLLLDAGDAPYNTNLGNLFEGQSTIEVMNAMKYDATVLGNHDFDFPFSVLERNSKLAKHPFLSANTYYKNKYPEFLKPSIVKEIDGIKIGIIGITDDESNYYTHPNNVVDISFKDHFEATQEAVDAIKNETDIIISLAHIHGDNQILPTKVNGIDIEIGGGQDIVDFPKIIEDTWLISPGKHSEVLNQINVNILNGKMIGVNFAHIFMTENLEEDEEVAKIIEKYSSQLGDKMKTVVGKTTVDLDGERQTVRLKESNLSNVIADSLIDLTGADIAFQNGGGVRASINKGEITMENVYATLPFDNTIVMLEASGQTIWDALEHGVSSYPAAAGGFLQVSGLEYTFDASKEPYSRITQVLFDGKPIDKEKTYKLVTNDFLSGGGDKFDMLKNDTKLLLKTKHFLRDAFVEYLEKNPTIAPGLEGRIKILNAVE